MMMKAQNNLFIKRRKGEEMDLWLRVRVDVQKKKTRKMLEGRGKRGKNHPNSLGRRRFPN
jgi:hypothetical protein